MSEPIVRTAHMDQLGASYPRPDAPSDLWTEVHEQIQAQFALLETAVRRKLPGVRVATGRTKGDRFHLFSYRTFSMPGSAIDPVVVGITFTPAQSGVAVEADVSGEQTGDLISSVPVRTVAPYAEEVTATARAAAELLCQSSDAITAALNDHSRRTADEN